MRTYSLFNLLILLFFITFPIRNVFSANYTAGGEFNFNVIMQNKSTSYITVGTDGLISSYDGIFRPQTPTVTNKINFTTSGWGSIFNERIRFDENQSTGDITINGCTFEFSKITPSANDVYVSSNTYDFYFTVTLTLKNQCSPNTYSGSFNLDYQTRSCIFGSWCPNDYATATTPVVFSYSFTIEEPLAVEETQSLHFGSILPGSGGVVTIDTDNGLSWNGVTIFDNTSGKSGIFRVMGIGGRQVNITLPSSTTTLYNDEGSSYTMNVTNLNLSTSTVVLPDVSDTEAIEYFSVGGTLTVGANQQPGSYAGTYTVQVSY